MLQGVGLYAEDFMCYASPRQGIEEVRPINVLIGRNNSGKSAFLEATRCLFSVYNPSAYQRKGAGAPQVTIAVPVTEQAVRQGYPENAHGGPYVRYANVYEYGKTLIGKRVSLRAKTDGPRLEFGEALFQPEIDDPQRLAAMGKHFETALHGTQFRMLQAERDILPEAKVPQRPTIGQDGSGATQVIERTLNGVGYEPELVKDVLLKTLNSITAPDTTFDDILTREHDNGTWEIFLAERAKGLISLTSSGTGLKTLILVLSSFLLQPAAEQNDPASYVFAFEELENNLHPGLQRRLFQFIEQQVLATGCTCFITTHSPVAVDYFAGKDTSQVLHVTNDGTSATVRMTETRIGGRSILEDLDVRASDVLLTNGVVWVEGITDRLYIRRWLDIACDEQGWPHLEPGVHYAFLEYGGRCLGHFAFDEIAQEGNQEAEDLQLMLPALHVGHHAAAVMDSDRDDADDEINETKQRVAEEAEVSWITCGREIENYLPADVVAELAAGITPGRFDKLSALYRAATGSALDKVRLASDACPRITSDNWAVLDLRERVTELAATIRAWNALT